MIWRILMMAKMLTFIMSLFLISLSSYAATHEPLTVDQGFQFSAKMRDKSTIVVDWKMAPGHFLYRKYLAISTDSQNIKLGPPLYPKGTIKSEPEVGDYEIYQNRVSIPIPIINVKNQGPPDKINLVVKYQGCSEEGYCYPPVDKHITLDLTKSSLPLKSAILAPIVKEVGVTSHFSDQQDPGTPLSKQEKITQLLSSGHYLTIVLSFLGFGLLLAFTPCVLPMLPILSGIIVGQDHKKLTPLKAFSLSLTYVLSMSITYATAGILIGYAGSNIQAIFQEPWMLIAFSLLFVALALSFFDLYELRLPQRLRYSFAKVNHSQHRGSYMGVALMGCIATLIVSPCVTPALVGALSYIGRHGSAVLGGTALFALGFGMGIPLLLIGTAGGKLLPKAGMWMNYIKSIFGVILLGMAIWMLDRVLSRSIILLLWAFLLILTASYMGILRHAQEGKLSKFTHGLAIIFLVYGILLLIGFSMGNRNPLQPLLSSAEPLSNAPILSATFKHVADESEISSAIQDASAKNKIVMLDFYANWCTSCKLMENRTFNHPEVAKILENFVTLKADVTENDKIAKNLERKFQVIAPPTLLFFDSTGKELEKFRIVGEMGPKEFLEHLQTVLKQRV
jgi:thioredoxin:protein disulfide reductase